MMAGGVVWGIRYSDADGKIKDVEVLNIRNDTGASQGVGIRAESTAGAKAKVRVMKSRVDNYTRVGINGNGMHTHVSVWKDGILQTGADNRADALAVVHCAPSIADVVTALTKAADDGQSLPPLCVATSARAHDGGPPVVGFAELRELARARGDRPLLILFGTGWGLTEEALVACDALLQPISGVPEFNHLSVRSAVAVVLDRLFGIRGSSRT